MHCDLVGMRHPRTEDDGWQLRILEQHEGVTMIPRFIRKTPLFSGEGEVWEVGGRRVLVMPGQEGSYVCADDAKDRKEQDWVTDELERIAKANGFWLKTAPSIDIMMIVVRSGDVAAFLQACADRFGGAQEA